MGTHRGNTKVIPRGWGLGGVINWEGGSERDDKPVGGRK